MEYRQTAWTRVQHATQTQTLPALLMKRQCHWRRVNKTNNKIRLLHVNVDLLKADTSSVFLEHSIPPLTAFMCVCVCDSASVGAGKLKARFESMAKASDEENRKKAEEERAKRQARESREKEEARRREQKMSSREEKSLLPQASDVCTPPQPEEPHTHVPEIEQIPEDEPLYDEPPALPPRGEDFLDLDAPSVPPRSAEVEEDDGDYEELSEPPPPPPSQLSEEGDNDYEDLTCGQKARAIYDYQGEADDEISFYPDDIITNVEMIDEGWWKGQCHGRIGLFPAAYVEML